MSSPLKDLSSGTPTWRVAVNWAIFALVVVGLIALISDLGARLGAPSFAIIRPENAGLYTLLGLLGIIGLVLATSYIGKLIGQRAKRGRPVAYLSILNDQLTHVFFWVFILFSLYPIFYVISSSLDPLNRLAQGRLGEDTDPLLLRARVLPSFEGSSFANYAKLFEGVQIYWYQWVFVGMGVLGIVGIAVAWALVQSIGGGTPTKSLTRGRLVVTWIAVLGISLFFITLSPAQFTGFTSASRFLLWLRNTFLLSGITGLLTVMLTTTTGYGLARLRFPGRFEFLIMLIFIQMFPALLGLVAVYELIYRLGLIETLPGLIIAYTGGAVSFGTWIYKGYVESLPPSLEEAALVDGCTRWTAFTKIVLPLSGPMLVFIFLLQFVGTYSEFFLANVLLTGATTWNIGVGLRSLAPAGFDTSQFGTFAAAAVLGALPIVALYYSFQQVFISGNLAGGVKE